MLEEDVFEESKQKYIVKEIIVTCPKCSPCSLLQLYKCIQGWRDGSEVKSTDCFSRGPEFSSQQPHGGSQPSVMGSDALFWCVGRQLPCTHINEINKSKKKRKNLNEKYQIVV